MRYSILAVLFAGALSAAPIPGALRSHLTFHASFDKGFDADVAKGDKSLYTAPSFKEIASAKPGAAAADIAIDPKGGIAGGGALQFKSKNTHAVFFHAAKAFTLAAGSSSYWLKVDPQKDLDTFTDAMQITDKDYNDSGIWTDFPATGNPKPFRLGVFGALKSWNPDNKPPNANPDFDRRLVVLNNPPISRDKWTHVVITWSGLGTASATAALYVDGKLVGNATGIKEPFAWDEAQVAMRIGLNYVGWLDEVAAFDKALSAKEVETLYRAGGGK